MVKSQESLCLRCTFARFANSTVEMKRLRHKFALVIGRWRMPLMQETISSWIDHTREQANIQCAETKNAEQRDLENANSEAHQIHLAAQMRVQQRAHQSLMRLIVYHQLLVFEGFREAVCALRKMRRVKRCIIFKQLSQAFQRLDIRVRTSRKLWSECRQVVLRMQRRFLAAAFLDLVHAVELSTHERERVATTIARWKAPWMLDLFARWVNYVEDAHEIQRQAQEEGNRQRLLGEQQQLKHEYAAAGDRLKERAHQVLLRILKQHLASAFASLQAATKNSKHQRTVARKVLCRLRRLQLYRGLQIWIHFAKSQRELRVSREAETLARKQSTGIQPVWFKQGMSIALGAKDRIQRQAQRTLQRSHLLFAFNAFVERVDVSIQFLSKAQDKLRMSQRATIVRRWQTCAKARSRWRRKLACDMLLIHRRTLQARILALQAWAGYSGDSGCWLAAHDDIDRSMSTQLSTIAFDNSLNTEQHVAQHVLHTLFSDDSVVAQGLAGCYALPHKDLQEATTAAQQSMQALCNSILQCLVQQSSKVIARMLYTHLALAFNSMVHATACSKKRRLVRARVVCRIQNARVAMVFDTFVSNAAATAEQRDKALATMLHAHLHLAFDSVVYAMACSKKRRLVCARVVRRINNLRVAVAFDTFVCNVEATRERHAKVRAVVSRWRSSSLALVLECWLRFVELRVWECERETQREKEVEREKEGGSERDNENE